MFNIIFKSKLIRKTKLYLLLFKMAKLEGKVSLVTGGGSGIGRGIAILFAKEGSEVIIIGRTEQLLKETCEFNPKKITYIVGDITKEESINNLIEYITKKFGKLDILVNNAGLSIGESIKELKLSSYDKTFDLNVRALVNITITCLPLILKSKGNILNISSISSQISHPGMSMYSGSKAAIDSFTRIWAKELAKDNVRVNAISPGAIETDIWNKANIPKDSIEKYKESVKKRIPCERFGTPEEVAKVALFLVSDDARYINGSIYNIDGAGDF